MVHLVCTLSIFQHSFVRQFVEHYRKMGVERFWLTPHVEPRQANSQAADDARQALAAAFQDVGVQPLPELSGDFDAMFVRRNHDVVQSRIPAADWIVWSDLDEFQVYPEPLADLLERADRNGEDALSGEFVDRIGRGGVLREFDPSLRIWGQFPIGCNLSAAVLGGFTHKVAVAKCYVSVGQGNHAVTGCREKAFRWWEPLVAIHHFKWDDTVLSRLARRLETDWKEKCSWWVETQRFVDYAGETRRVELEHLKTFDFGDNSSGYDRPEQWKFVAELRNSNAHWKLRHGLESSYAEAHHARGGKPSSIQRRSPFA
jgi:hypothetical protein